MKLGYNMKKRIMLVLIIAMLLGMTLQVSASERSVGYMGDCTITVGCVSNGVSVTWQTTTTSSADVIGVKDIVLQEKVNGVWRDISINGGYKTNATSYGASAIYTSAVAGRTYRAYCTHYATWGSTTKTLSNSTGEMVYN